MRIKKSVKKGSDMNLSLKTLKCILEVNNKNCVSKIVHGKVRR